MSIIKTLARDVWIPNLSNPWKLQVSISNARMGPIAINNDANYTVKTDCNAFQFNVSAVQTISQHSIQQILHFVEFHICWPTRLTLMTPCHPLHQRPLPLICRRLVPYCLVSWDIFPGLLSRIQVCKVWWKFVMVFYWLRMLSVGAIMKMESVLTYITYTDPDVDYLC